jgi:hypothetical protein
MKTYWRSRGIAELNALREDRIDDLLKNAYQTEIRKVTKAGVLVKCKTFIVNTYRIGLPILSGSVYAAFLNTLPSGG